MATRSETLPPSLVETAVALFLQHVRGVPMAAVKAVRFPVFDGTGTPQAIAEVDEDIERAHRSSRTGEGRIPETPQEISGSGI